MARKVAQAFSDQQHLIAEAGTGIGKSFAYLAPAILYATENQLASSESTRDTDDDDFENEPRRRRVLISTHTISLQEQ